MLESHLLQERVEARYQGARLVSDVQACVYLEEFGLGIEVHGSIDRPSADDDRWLGVCHFQRVEDAQAQAAFERAIDKGQQAARVNLAHLLRMSDRSERAADELQKVDFARLTPYDQVFFLRVKSIHEETNGNLRDALRYSEEAWRRLQGLPEFAILAPSILSQLGILHGRIGRAQRAIWFLERGMQLTTGLQHVKARIRWTTVMIAQGKTELASEALRELESSSVPEPMQVEIEWLSGEIAWLMNRPDQAIEHYTKAIEIARKHQVVYEEFLCQLALATILAFRGDGTAIEHMKRAQELVTDRSDQLAYRFREVLVLVSTGLYRTEHAVRELLSTAEAFGDMGLLQEQGFVRLHVCAFKHALADDSYVEEIESLTLLARSLQNPAFLERELHFVPELRNLIEAHLPSEVTAST